VVTQTIAAEGDGTWREYAGGYSDWAAWKAASAEAARAAASPATSPKPPAKTAVPAKPRADKLSWKEQRELEALPGRIAELEAEQGELTRSLEDPTLYQRDARAAQQASERLAAIDDELLVLLERWEALEARTGNAA
jgi:ATP-binding cassette subfamily F protein uup